MNQTQQRYTGLRAVLNAEVAYMTLPLDFRNTLFRQAVMEAKIEQNTAADLKRKKYSERKPIS